MEGVFIYKFERYIKNGVMYGYYTKTKFSNGQTGILFFEKDICYKIIEWNVIFGINNKRKHIMAWIEGKESMDATTGKCGLEGLIWARNGLLAFEDFIGGSKFKQRIVVSWTDSKTKRVYERYLKKIGYRFTIHYGREFLIKDII